MEIKLQDLLSERIIDVLDKHGVTYGKAESDAKTEKFTVELYFTTPKGGDGSAIVEFLIASSKEDADKEFCYGLEQEYENFDVEIYVYDWLEAKKMDKKICPLGAVELVEEGQWIENLLYTLYKETEKLLL